MLLDAYLQSLILVPGHWAGGASPGLPHDGSKIFTFHLEKSRPFTRWFCVNCSSFPQTSTLPPAFSPLLVAASIFIRNLLLYFYIPISTCHAVFGQTETEIFAQYVKKAVFIILFRKVSFNLFLLFLTVCRKNSPFRWLPFWKRAIIWNVLYSCIQILLRKDCFS